jgi:carboxyl-terminal processing protease
MKFLKTKFSYCILAVSLLALSGCTEEEEVGISKLDLEINEFIWSSMKTYYLWTDNVPNLALTGNNLSNLKKSESNHEKFFEKLIYKRNEVDRWSWIVDDYVELENSFNGIEKSTGANYRLYRFTGSANVFGVVRYVTKGSPADLAGIKRGYIFTQIDDQAIDTINYQTISSKESITFSFATAYNNIISLNGLKAKVITAVVQENPIYLDTIYVEKGTKIGYLVLNQFIGNYDNALNNVFGKFKTGGVTELIIDFRYNPGGSMLTANYLASMIHSNNTSKVSFKINYNTAGETELRNSNNLSILTYHFNNTIAKSTYSTEAPINTLNLTERIYIITSNSTASASEMVINTLKPYMDVVIIGDYTVGKYVGSTTIKDEDLFGNVNPNHKWAIQPIILKYSNSLGISDFGDGIAPTIKAVEDISNLLPLGNKEEILLKTTLNKINGITTKSAVSNDFYVGFKDSKDLKPHSKEMFLNLNTYKSK